MLHAFCRSAKVVFGLTSLVSLGCSLSASSAHAQKTVPFRAALPPGEYVTTTVTAPDGLPTPVTLQVLPESAVHLGLAPAKAGRQRSDPADSVLFDNILDTSYDGNPDLLWGFPTTRL